ncbi:MAG: alkaline phosphatase family protein [Ignavibacteriales bacterium CG_4_9_14_3_um_filter_34_10]|nr:MAG: alkaline phosphatase family protein [Ignavibacteriales bacterium CG_4_9_14_3_um_filter_34_10]
MFKKFLFVLFISFTLIAGEKPYVLLISFDGFRWDYLDRGLSPNIEKFYNDGIRAMSLQPCFPSKTFPNHYSIITGMYPENHGIISNYFKDIKRNQVYRLGDSAQVRNSEWYLGEAFWETAERNRIKTASYFWPGSEVHLSYRHPSYFMEYNQQTPYKDRVDGVINWLKLPKEKRPHFITLYFEDTDNTGHDFGPDSKEVNESIVRLDNIVKYLDESLKSINFRDSINIIIVSDHGMTSTPKEKIINIESIVPDFGCKFIEPGPVMKIECDINKIEAVYQKLNQNENHYRVFRREDVPDYFHYSKNPFISPIIIVADLGYSLVDNRTMKRSVEKWSLGNHGFDNHASDMHGIFVANGSMFRKNYKTGSVLNIDIYPLLCKIFDIFPRANIDGDLSRIKFILKEE